MYRQSIPGRRGSAGAFLLFALVFGASAAHALGLGALAVRSRLGAPLLAEVRLLEVADGDRHGDECFRLVVPEADQEMPALTQAHLHVEQRGGEKYLVIRSSQPVDEPVLQVNLRIGCGSELVRRYSLLIDPGDAPTVAAPATAHSTADDTSGDDAKRPVAAVAGATRRTQRRLAGETDENPPAPANPVRTGRPSARARTPRPDPSGGKLADRLLIGGTAEAADGEAAGVDAETLNLRSSTVLSVHLSPSVSENTRATLRIEYKLLDALHAQAAQQLELAAQVRQLEAHFAELKAINTVVQQGADPAASTMATAASDPAPLLAASATLPAAPQSPAVTAPIAPAGERSGGGGGWPVVAAALSGAGALAAGWRYRRRRAVASLQTSAEQPAAALELPPPVSADDPWDDAETVFAPQSQPSPARLDILLDASAPASAPPVAPPPAVEVNHVSDIDDTMTVLELAEIMVSFGRIKGAAQALAEYLEHNPDKSVAPWLRLLEIYRMNDMPEEFAACASELRRHFNVATASWDEAAATLGERLAPSEDADLAIDAVLKKLPALATMPHVCEAIVQRWDSADAVTYLTHLFRDTRNGQRGGFPLTIARELLFLLDLQESRLRRHNS